jgi:hypothetical protein
MMGPFLPNQSREPAGFVEVICHSLKVFPLTVRDGFHVIGDRSKIEKPFVAGKGIELFRTPDPIAEKGLPVRVPPEIRYFGSCSVTQMGFEPPSTPDAGSTTRMK